MALFGSKRGALQTLLSSGWGEEAQRDHFLAELRKSPPKAVELVPTLWHADAEVRKTGAALFLQRAGESDVEALIQALLQKSPQIRNAMIPLLARVPAATLQRSLEKMFADGTPQSRRLAWEVALSLPKAARTPYFQRSLFEAPSALRLKSVRELIESGNAAAHLETLLGLATDENPEIAPAALQALATVRDPRVLDLMLDRLAEGDEVSRGIADGYLRSEAQADPEGMKEALLEVLTRGTEETRRIAMEILLESNSPEQIVPRVLEICNRVAGWMRARIVEALRACGEPVLRASVQLMQHPDRDIRTGAIMMLADGFDDKRLVEPFCKVLGDEDWWLRVTACQVLGHLGDERAVPALVHRLKDEDTRWSAVDALAQIGATSALQPLSQLLRDPRQEVRQEVLQAFSRFRDPRLLKVLQAVRDRDPASEIRDRAAEILDEMSRSLGQAVEASGAGPAQQAKLSHPVDKLLVQAREMGASDLDLSVGEPPLVRLDGVLTRLEGAPPLGADEIREMVDTLLDEAHRKRLEEDGAVDFSYEIEGAGRHRANAYVQRLGVCASFRIIPGRPPTFRSLGLPSQLEELLDYHQGLIVISGPAGNGKSTSLTALVNLINETKPLHILTLEDPIEFVHPPKMALVNQRQIGRDSDSFAHGLRAALREDPDVIVVGELRDSESVRLALEAAETGHVVIATMHTASAVQTIERLVGAFPTDEQSQVRTALSESLKYIVCQRLLPGREGKGRVALFEVLKGTLSIGNMIRKNETFQIPGLMQIGQHIGMRTVDMALKELLETERITPETAWQVAEKRETFAPLCDPAILERMEAIE